MTKIFLALSIVVFATIACSKTVTSAGKKSSDELGGKWKHYQSYQSIGGPLIYDNILPGKFVEFKSNGELNSNMEFFQPFKRYEIIDSSSVKFIGIANIQNDRLYRYSYDSNTGNMNLSPMDYVCIEGCGFILRR